MRSLFRLGSTLVVFLLTSTAPADAQSITAAPDGTGTRITIDGNTYQVQGGTQTGTNLFHSFQNFSLSPSETANFFSNPNITHIFGRVTGGVPSLINGLIKVTGANANLYLMNPAGIVFGAGASLNVGGDFTATTADRIGFAGGWFNATGANDYTALVGTPNQFAFLQAQPGAILNQGNLQADGNLSLLGGAIENEGNITSTQGQVTLAAVPGTRLVNLAQPGMLLSLDLPQTDLNQGVSPLDLPALLTGPVGDVAITGGVQGVQIDLYAAGQVQTTDSASIQGDTRVVRFSTSGENPNQAVFIDRRADHPEALLFGAAPGTVSQIIERDENGVSVISEQLSVINDSVGELDSVAIVAEGNAGNFWLGNQWLHHENIGNYAAQLQTWGTALTANADLLLYSCFTALGATGEALVQSLADLTGADVAASVDVTGSAQYGGNWVLEYSIGAIEAVNPLQASTLTAWDGKLSTQTVTSLLDDNSGGTLREAIAAASAEDLIMFDVVGTVKLNGTEIDWSTDKLTIDGNGSVIDGQSASRVFRIRADNATLQDLTIQKGSVSSGGGGIGYTGDGTLTLNNVQVLNNVVAQRAAGIRSTNGLVVLQNSLVSGNSAGLGRGGISVDNNDLILTNSRISDNSAGTFGGGIRADNMTVINSTIANNSAGSVGAGIHHPEASGTVTLINSTVSGNTAGTFGGGINAMGELNIIDSTIANNSTGNHGGGIRATGDLTLTNSTVSDNSAAIHGGGISATQTLTLNSSEITDNFASNSGGGIHVSGAIEVTNSTIAGNTANLRGGGIHGDDTVTLSSSTVSGNFASNEGGGIYANGAARLFNSTISGNVANTQGGGIFVSSPLTLTNTTIAFNTASVGGGGVRVSGLAANQITNTIIAQNTDTGTSTPDLSADLSSSTVQYSLITDTAGITGLTLSDGVNGNIIGQDPRLSSLQQQGSSPPTHALLPDSPAIDSGNNALALDKDGFSLTTAQTGQPRLVSGLVDMGAYEFVIPIPPVTPPPAATAPLALPTSRRSFPLCGLLCQQYRTLSVQDPSLAHKAIQILSVGVDGVEVKMTNNYAALVLENGDAKPLAIAQAQMLMRNIEQQTGVRPAVLYLTFVPDSFQTNSDEQLQLILVRPEGEPIVRHPVGVTRSQVIQTVQALQLNLNMAVGDSHLAPAQQLYDWLIRPLQDPLQALGIEHLAIVADEGLRSLPMAALHDGDRFLIEDYSLGLMPSLSLVDWQYQPLHNATILAMGASEFDEQPPLPAVPIELSLIAENPNLKYLNNDFTYTNLRTQAKQRQFQILHLATHAQFRQGAADAAYIQLWGKDDVQLQELREFQLHQDPALELLVLSACDTAVGDATAELGFAGAALQAGVKSVLASLWQVSDVGTLALMNSFYTHLAHPNVTIKAEALRQAQLGLLHGEISVQQGHLAGVTLPTDLADYLNTDLTHPYYWSAFTLIGSPW